MCQGALLIKSACVQEQQVEAEAMMAPDKMFENPYEVLALEDDMPAWAQNEACSES